MSGLAKSKGLAFDSGGPSDYSELDNKPSINGVELDGDKSTEQLKIGINHVVYVVSDVSELPAVSGEGGTALVISANGIGLFYIANSLTGYNWELNTNANSKQYVGKVILCTDTQEFYVCLSYSYGTGYTWIKGGGPKIITDGDNTDLEVKAGTIYDFGDTPITELTITSAEKSYQESVIYFVTGGTIQYSFPNTIKWGGDGSAPSLEINKRYCIAICNGLVEIDNFGTTA